jgi:argininosuccinate lyase
VFVLIEKEKPEEENLGKREGFFERVQGKINPVVVEHYYADRFDRSHASFPYLLKVMKAHAVMLGSRKIIPPEVAASLLAGMQSFGGDIPELDPKLEDLYINFEHLLARKVGKDICGHLPVARSRNDVEAAMWRIELRERMLVLVDSLRVMVDTLHKRVRESSSYVFPGYTYGQQAQPVTMGHHLLGFSSALLRDMERILACVGRFDLNPLGSAALCGSSYPVDRKLTAALLGFDGVWEHTSDSVAGADYMLEAAGCALTSLVTLSRLAEDIIFWCSTEVGFTDLPDDLIDSSTIMPQKRNPVICATVRAQARIFAGRYAGICAAASTNFQASRDVTVAWTDVLETVREANGMCRISAEYVKGLIFKKDAMERALLKGFSNATELADTLVMEGGLPFRLAHTLVGSAVSQLFDEGQGQDRLTWELLNQRSLDICGKELPLSAEQVAKAKDFRIDAERRDCQGGTSQKEIANMLEQQGRSAEIHSGMAQERRRRWAEADTLLDRQANEIVETYLLSGKGKD